MNELFHRNILPDLDRDEEELNLRQYLNTLLRYKWAILGLTAIITLIAAIYVNTLQPIYRATATVLIESQPENVVSIEEVYRKTNAYYEYYYTQLQIMRSRGLAERVITDYGFANHPYFAANSTTGNSHPSEQPAGLLASLKHTLSIFLPEGFFPEKIEPQLGEDKLLNNQVSKLQAMLEVKFVEDTQIASINFDSGDPNLATRLANALADAYIKSGLESRLQTTKKAADWITVQMKELKQKVDQSEQALQDYLDREQLVDAKGVDAMAVNKLDDLSSRLVDARSKTTESSEVYRQVMALKGQPIEAYESIPVVLNSGSVNQARTVKTEIEKRISELEKRYGPKHPKMIAARAEYESATRNLHTQIKNVVASLEKEYSIARAEEAHLSGAMNSARNEVADINRKGHELKTLQQEVETNRNLYDMFLTRFKETSATENLQTTSASIVDNAIVPVAPYKPDKQKFVLIFLVLGLVISVVLVFIVEAIDNTLKDSSDVENKLLLPVLSILPKLSIWVKKDLKAMRYFSDKNHSSFAENIRTVRTSVLLSDIDNAKKTILITSSIPEEGKSIVAVNLALALARIGKTLLIDADMRKPSIRNVFGLRKTDPGLSHFIAGTKELPQCVHFFKEENLYVMPAGATPANPLELLSSKRFKNGMDILKHNYNFIVMDSAPTIPVSDPIVLSRVANEIIYVVKADDTPYQLAKTGINKLHKVDANVVGVILNMVNPARRPGKYGYSDSDYYSYYGYYSR